ncbi:hypothetical protein BQ8794_130011 [Mesorhizobium prunaredense]|uniref:Uncharacterized protein n=1 Tax=Mesorhizobium prunaredense TaxID=1631249 RepID=A0A1R3V2Q8_9HYPH|nr:hypothetical protein BQ8794_130011 [Mesorhizobium prunaredense]
MGPFSFAGWGELYGISCIIANLVKWSWSIPLAIKSD